MPYAIVELALELTQCSPPTQCSPLVRDWMGTCMLAPTMYMQAADFFADEVTVAGICALVGPRLLLWADGADGAGADAAVHAPHKRPRTASSSAATTSAVFERSDDYRIESSIQAIEVRPRGLPAVQGAAL